MFRISDFELGSCEAPPGFVDHVLCDVSPNCVEPTTCGFSGDIAGAACHVEQFGTRLKIDGSEQRIDGLLCHLADEGIVMQSLFGPACSLELFELLALLLADRHGAPSGSF